MDALLNYDKTFNQDHHFKAMAGYKIEKYDYRNLEAFRKSFPNSEVTDLNGGDSSTQTNSGYSVNWLCYLISDVSIMTIKASIFWKPISVPMLLLVLQRLSLGIFSFFLCWMAHFRRRFYGKHAWLVAVTET